LTAAVLTFNEAYSREYLSKHWFIDILSGVLYGAVLLAPLIAAVRLIAGPAVTPGQAARVNRHVRMGGYSVTVHSHPPAVASQTPS
jgi:membrane-associated phospholipid phosphatase